MAQGQHGRRVDHRGLQELVGEGVVGTGPGGVVERAPGPLEEDATGQRVAVGAQPGRGEADQAVARRHAAAIDDPVALDDPDGESDEVETLGFQGPWVLGHLAPDNRTAGLAAALGHTFEELLHLSGVEAAHGDVVEEEERLRTLGGDVVDAHGHQVDPDGGETARRLRHQGLGADPVGGGDQHGVAVAVLVEGEQATEAPYVADDLGPERRSHPLLDASNRLVAGGDADPGPLVRLTHGQGRRGFPRGQAARRARPSL